MGPSKASSNHASSLLAALGCVLLPAGACATGANAKPITVTDGTDFTALSLEDLGSIKIPKVVGASKYEQKTTEAPSSISIIPRDDLRRYGHRTLADALQSLQGFHVSNDRNYSFLGPRGIDLGDFNSRTLLLVDGHRVNNNLTDGAALGSEFILDLDLIDRVEVIRGPGSVLYGNNAFFGVINVVTRKGSQLDGAEVSGEYASFDTYKGRLSVGKSFKNGPEFLVSGTLYDSAGSDGIYFPEFDERISTNPAAKDNGLARNMDADSSGSLFGSMSYRGFTLQGGWVSRKKVNPTALQFTTFNDPRLRTVDDRSYVDLTFTHEFPDVVEVSASVYYDRSGYQIGYPVGTPVASAFFQEVQAGEWWGAELQLTKRLWDRHTVIAGVEYRDDFRQEKRVFDDTATYTDLQASRQSYGTYLQGDFALGSKLHLIAGVRYDQYGEIDPTINPRVAAIWNPIGQSTFKAIYGTAFRSPNFIEVGDPRLRSVEPEEITSYELVYEQGIGEHLRSSVAGFYNQMDRLIVFESGGFANVDARSQGLELALEGNWSGGLRGRASYTFQETDNDSASGHFPNSPQHLFKFNLSVPVLKEKLFVSAEYQFTGSRRTSFTSDTGDTLPGVDAPGYSVLNLTLLGKNIVKNLDASASVYNVFDQAYSDPSTSYHVQDKIPRDGIGFRLKLTYGF